MLIIFISIVVAMLLLFIYSACVISSWCRKEEENETKVFKRIKKEFKDK